MKKFIPGILLFTLIFVCNSCVDEQIVIPTQPAQGKILIDSNPRNAKILFLGTDIGKNTPDSLMNIESGTYEITLKLEDYRDTTFNVIVLNNYKTTKFINLEPVRQTGSIFINSDPNGAQIFLSGTFTGRVTPDTLADLSPGAYPVLLKHDGYRDTTFNANVINGGVTNLNITLQDTLPLPDVIITYRSIQFNQVLFSCIFNQDIYLTKIETIAPLTDTTNTTGFQDELISKGQEVVLFFQYISGTWNFTIYGRKAGGDMKEFIITKQVFVL